jgi:hypothetical protein
MAIRRASGFYIEDNTITSEKIANNSITTSELLGVYLNPPTVSNVSYNDNDLAASNTAGQVAFILGSGFKSGLTIYIGNTLISSYSLISSSNIRITTPELAPGSYNVHVVNSDGGYAIKPNGYTSSVFPVWISNSSLGSIARQAVANITLSATQNANYTLSTGSSLPSNLYLNSNGRITGTVLTTLANTTYTFTAVATDAENQDTPKTFSLLVL